MDDDYHSRVAGLRTQYLGQAQSLLESRLLRLTQINHPKLGALRTRLEAAVRFLSQVEGDFELQLTPAQLEELEADLASAARLLSAASDNGMPRKRDGDGALVPPFAPAPRAPSTPHAPTSCKQRKGRKGRTAGWA